MKKQTLLKSTLCLLMALVCNVAWAQVATIQSSNSVENPEYMYELRSANNYWMTSYTSPTSTASGTGKFAFFAVDGQDGAFKIYSVDRQKWVSYTKADSYSAGVNKATLVDAEEDANAWKASIANGYWSFAPYKNDATVASIYWNWHGGVGSNPLDNTNKTIGFYGTIGDGGCKWSLYAYEGEATGEDLANAKNLIKVAPGYPKTSTTAYNALNNFALPSSKAFLNVIVTAYKTATDIILPEDGKAYTFTSVMGEAANGTRYYMKYVNGQKVSVSKTESDASVFVCKELRAGVYAFVTEDGHILTWVGNDENGAYKENNNIYGYSSNYATEYNNKSDWNEITVKKNGTDAKDLGYLRLVGRRHSTATSAIIANKNNRFDQSGDSYYFNTDNSSAWILTKVDHTNTDAQNLALAKIDAKENVKPYVSKVGNGIGYAYYLVGGQEQYTDVNAAIDAATTVDAVNEIKNSVKFKVPQAGTLYALYDATHSVYLDIHDLGVEKNDASYTQLATLNTSKQFLYITGSETDGTWKIHTTPEGGSYLHQSSSRSWNSWVSDAGGTFTWEVEPIVENEQLVYKLKNVSGTENGYLGADNHTVGSSLYVNSANALKLSLVSATPEEDLAYAKYIAKQSTAKLKNQPGYYYCTINGEKVYDAAVANAAIDAATTKEAVAEIAEAIKNASVVLPEPGKAYTMTLVANNNEKTQYKIIANDGTLTTSASTEGENSVFYCLQSNSNDYPYIFVSEDGYVLGYNSLVETYYSADSRNNFKVEAMAGKTKDNDHIKSEADVRLGTVCITTASRNPVNGGGKTGCLIFKYNGDGAPKWDNSSDPYHNETYTSAIAMTEVENYVVPTAQQTKIDDILGKDAVKTQVEAIRNDLKNQPGYYYCTIGGEKVYDADAILALIDATQSLKTLNEISTAVTNKTLITPEVGKYYRIKGKTSGNYIDASGQTNAQMNMKADPNILGSIFLFEEGSRLKNMSTGTYVYNTHSIGATQGDANTWTFISSGTGYFKVKSNYSSPWLHDSGNKANRCSSDDADHEFIIEEVPSYALTIDAPAPAGATATWNGETKALPATWTICEGMTITNTELTLNYENVNYTFGGLFEGEQQVELPSEIATLEANRNLTAKLTPAFFSKSTKAEDLVPVQIYNYRDKGYTICLNKADGYTDHAVNSGTTEYSLDEIWYLVGDAESFKMYSHTAGMNLALTLAGTGSGSAATMTANGTELSLTISGNAYCITPKANKGQSFNMHGGKGNDIKLYGSSDAGSVWGINVMDITHSLTYSVTVSGTPWDGRYGVGELTFNVKGISSNTHITEAVAAQTCYLPKNATFTLSSIPYRGYTFSVPGGAESYEGTLAEGNLTVELAYTANEEKILYHTPDANGKPYRIPAIAAAPNGHIFAIADNRPCGKDIGYGEVDIKCRISKDNGATWGDEFFIANGLGELAFLSEEDRNKTGEELDAAKATVNNMHIGFGDAAVVADRESNKLLVMMVAGRTVCHNGRWDKTKIGDTTALAVNRVARIYLTYNEETGEWDKSEIVEMTDHIYSLFLNGETPTVTSMFIGSGKICQSRVVKKDQYYRLYCSMWTRDGGNRVIYSDDFGGTWNVLGTINDRPASGGDEPKVEELADGTVVLSSRKYHGRYFNLFTFDNEGKTEEEMYTTGTWDTAVASNDVADGLAFGYNSTNGEIYKVKAVHKETGRVCDLMLQSIPTGDGRNNVAIYYKELNANTYTPTTIAQGWTKGKHVSYKSSCYSTMIMQADGRIAFLFEEAPGEYCIVYIPYTIEDLTGGAYTSIGAPTTGYYRFVNKDTNRKEYLYNDAILLGNTFRFTLQTDDVMTTNNGIWRITKNAEDKLGVMNGDGNPIVAGASYGGSILGTYNELTINTYKDGYYYFTEALNCSNGNNFTVGGVPFLTTWAGHPDANDNQWRLEPVSIEGKTIYEVVVDGDANAYVAYDNGTTVQNAFNGGFFITDGAITETQLKAGFAGNVVKSATITVEDNVITLADVVAFPTPVKKDLYNTSNGSLEIPPYRIPGITVDPETGRIITTAARLVCGTDPGYGQVDVVCRISDNHGETWSEMKEVAVGTGVTSPTENYFDTAFGDPAVVADRTSNEVLIIVVAGCTKYQTATRAIPNMIGTIHSKDNGETWDEPVNVTEGIYSLFDSGNPMESAFVGGGKIFQSRIVKVGNYYRLYAAMCARPNGNRVIYSDDFGRTWKALGGPAALPAPGGDEPKCEELPDGRVILSSRVGGGRIYNIYTYSNTETAEGEWGTSVKSTFEGSGYDCSGGQSTNGEILIVPVKRNSDGEDMYLALQSLPTSGRSRVGIFYKELTEMTDINSVHGFATDWNGFYLVTTEESAYSSMDLQNDNRIGFIYEENYTKHGVVSNPHSIDFPDAENLGTHNYDGYDNMYIAYELEFITNGAYSINRDVDRKDYLNTYFTALTKDATEEVRDAVATDLAAMNAEPTIAQVDKIYFTMSKGSAVTAFDENAGTVGFFTSEAVATYKTEVMAATQPEGLAEAKAKLLGSKLNIVSGKAYTFKNVQKDGTTMRWYKYDTEQGKIVLTATEDEATPFVCRLLENGKYVFVCNDGKYMIWRASVNGYTDGTGVRDAYHGEDRFLTDITIAKMTSGNNITGDLSTTRYVTISANRPDKNNVETGYVVVKKNSGSPVFDGAGAAYYNNDFSSAFIMEEATFGNAPTVNGVGESELMSEDLHGKHMSTFSATYATVAPEGVTAYYATKSGKNVVLNVIAKDNAIPANTGVILVSEEGGNAVMLPAAGETSADVTGNLMGHSAGAAKDMTDIANAYILTGGAQGAGFYLCSGGTLAANKAYLVLPAQAGSNAPAVRIRLAGEQGGTTEIESSELDAQGSQLIYDLQGRRVLNPTKGIYIVNGKKVIVK